MQSESRACYPSAQAPLRRACTVARIGLIAIVTAMQSAQGIGVNSWISSDAQSYGASYQVAGVTVDDAQLGVKEPAFWNLDISIIHEDGLNDELFIGAVVNHLTLPHGGHRGGRFAFGFEIKAAKHPQLPQGNVYETPVTELTIDHGNHGDSHQAFLWFITANTNPGVHISSYQLFAGAEHWTVRPPRGGGGTLTPTPPANEAIPDAAANLSLFLDPVDGRLNASITAIGLSLEAVTGVRIRAASEDQTPARTVYAFDSSSFQSVENEGFAGSSGAGVYLAAADVAALLRGEGFVEILTTDFPSGALRGDITVRPPMPVLGDLNGDGDFNNFDIVPFELALTDPAAYAAQFAGINSAIVGDINQDGAFNNFDISEFEQLLSGGEEGQVEVPEPGSALVAIALVTLIGRRRGTRPAAVTRSMLIALGLCISVARADPIVMEPRVYNDDPELLSVRYDGDKVFDEEPLRTYFPNDVPVKWFNLGDIAEARKDNGHDRMSIDFQVQHFKPPDDDGPNVYAYFKSTIDAENYTPATHPEGGRVIIDRAIPHKEHHDGYTVSVSFDTIAVGGKFDIINYRLRINAVHDDNRRVSFRPGSSMADPTALAMASFPDARGEMSLFLYPADNRFHATVVAEGLGAEDLTGARIRAGTGADTDPTLFALSREVFAVGPAGSLVATLKSAQLTADATAALLAGEAYIEFLTTDFPTGALRGSIEVRAIPPLVGDLNGDRAFDNFDIAPFELALTDAAAFAAQFPAVDPLLVGDVNQDGAFDNFDIAAFEQLLSGAEGQVEIPEPSSALIAIAVVTFIAPRRGTRLAAVTGRILR